MRAKLIKDHDDYHLVNNEQFVIGTTDESILSCTDKYKLSLKNCQAIERGYDLDELVKEQYPIDEPSFKRGFKLALEILGNKRFTLEDMMNCWNKALNFQEHKETLGEHMQSLQQTEWDVEIVMGDPIGIGDKYTPDTKPKLDADGCLILKRVKE